MSLGRPQQGPLSDEGAALHQSQPQGPEEITDLAPAPTVRLTSPQARSYGLSSPSRRSPGAGNSERDALLSGGGNDGTGAGSDEERAQGTAHKRKWWMRGTGSTRGDGWENESPYDSVGVRIMFAIGVVMLFLA